MAETILSLYSGAGGLDAGFWQSGCKPVLAIDNDADACRTLSANLSGTHVLHQSVTEVTAKTVQDITGQDGPDAVIGGPPCQAFSVFGNRLGVEDARGQLVFEFVRLVEELQPKAFLMENVRGMLSMSLVPKTDRHSENNPSLTEKGSLMRELTKLFNQAGYHVDIFVVNSANYGASQIRERVLVFGNRIGRSAQFPAPQFSNRAEDGLPPFRTLGDVIGPGSGFFDPDPDVMDFSERKLKYLSMVPPGGNWRSLPVEIQKESMGKSWYLKGGRSAYWRKLSFDFPSPTVVTSPNHAGTSMCHPTELRAISVGEASVIQGFPYEWKFYGTVSSKFRQVGNAVPVVLGKIAADVMKSLLTETSDHSCDNDQIGVTETHLRPHIRTRSFWRNGRALAGSHSYYVQGPSEQTDWIKDL